MTVVDGRWPFVGRNAEVSEVARIFSEEGASGVVLIGASGLGKTLIAQRVISAVSSQYDHLYLRGSSTHATTPYGALNVLIAELDEATAACPLLVLTALQRRFETQGGRPTLMHIDGVRNIDELSATVIAHLARVGAVRLLITCEEILDAPGEFFDLWKDGVLKRLDLEPLSPDAAMEMLATALGAPVSRSASQELWLASGGNPRYLQLAAKADVASGHLFLLDGVWVSRDSPRLGSGRSDTDWTAGKLAALDGEDRALLEVLAVAGHLPVAVVLQVAAPESLDRLQQEGLLGIGPEDRPMVGLAYQVLADVVRAQLLSGAGRRALEVVAQLRHEPSIPAASCTALAQWTMDQGATLEVDELTLLARLANDHRIDGAAERFLRAVPPGRETCSTETERARRLWLDGRTGAALDAVDAIIAASSEDTPLPDWVEIRLLAARLSIRTHGREQDAAAHLRDVRGRLVSADAHAVGELLDRTDLLRLELDFFEGELEALREHGAAVLSGRSDESAWSAGVRGLLGVAQAMTGSPEAGLSAVRTIAARLETSGAGTLDQEAASVRLFGALLVSGRWGEGLALARARSNQPGALVFGGSSAEFAEGLLLAFLGRSRKALVKLTPAISQFRMRDRHGLLPLAEAAAAYAHALENDAETAEDHLRAIDLSSQRYPWHLREAVQYFTLLTEAWLDTPEVVVTEFVERAADLGSRGYRGVELFFLSQAVQLGRHDVAESLAASASATDGHFARLVESFAKALSSQDPRALKEVARAALDSDNYTLAGDIAALSVQHLGPADDPMIRVHAEQILRRTSTPARRHVRRKLLSERERAIARLVAQGVANKDIAQQEHISPRTVEGHVHQVMTKLGLSSRKQLSLIFGQQP
ncbi:LuxR C-terminal-related transcriptional regulator [Arthrobacter agilis]|uniref:helix-turn-helix transcriptional regulator n=1 Tax=Arthrobacter agilis TaxID=37921 RepID=UPI002366BD7B|nr:LuxR C-terminal-related transcriptional regulator [Arthrobacter agilis]WDF34262.1 LuxR C-terminal-related transcriptional regulator [Arthrobacter agilis]